MRAAVARKIENLVSRVAAAVFGGACGYSTFTLLTGLGAQPSRMAMALGAAAFGYLLCDRLLAKVGVATPRFAVPVFNVAAIEPMGPAELELTDSDRLVPAAGAGEPLELDDVLAEIGPDARVVRLFDPAAMPTPGQLKARIDRHLDQGVSGSAPPDASQALYDALSELRRSMR